MPCDGSAAVVRRRSGVAASFYIEISVRSGGGAASDLRGDEAKTRRGGESAL